MRAACPLSFNSLDHSGTLQADVPDFPPELQIKHAEAMQYIAAHPELHSAFDAVIANPPYVRWENIPKDWQERIQTLFGREPSGRADLYIAFLHLGLELVKPGGFLLYVLPHAFLIADSASPLRSSISASCWIRYLVDLSEVDVFDEATSYPILLIAERKASVNASEPPAVVVRCSAFAGQALQEALSGTFTRSRYYSIYDVPQSTFARESWRVLSPADNLIREKLARFPQLQDFLNAKEGVITGADKVFIRKRSAVPSEEMAVYLPLLTDREMRKFKIPRRVDTVVFYHWKLAKN